MKIFKITLAFLFTLLVAQSYSQSTWAYVYTLLQKNGCTGSCHNGTGSSTLNLEEAGDIAKVYDNIINIDPTNPAAKDKHNKLIYPGVPELSFLLRKINNGFDDNLTIETAEGDNMPVNIASMSNRDIEVVRQWILYGAKETGNIIDTATISNYYNTYGNSPYKAGKRMAKPTAPNSGDGFQMHFGPIFLKPQTETELNIKIPLFLDQNVDVTKIEEYQNYYSHHFILYKYTSSASSVASGIRTVSDFTDVSNGTMVSAWSYSRTVTLPHGAAYKWGTTSNFDFNYHLPNHDVDSIMAAEVYLNIDATTQSSSRQQMYSTLINYGMGGAYPFLLNLPNLNVNDTLTDATYDSNNLDSLYIWLLGSHTHKYGKDYDIYKRNSNGTRGEQLYEGYYNEDYTFNQGYYDWQHPAVRYFEPAVAVSQKDGLIHEAVFDNTGTSAVGYGLTTNDEMMLFFMQYTLSPLDTSSTSVAEIKTSSIDFTISPNPASEKTCVNYTLDHNAQVKLEIFDALGKSNELLINKTQTKGNYQFALDIAQLSSGIYNVRLSIDGNATSKKLIYTSTK